MAMQSNAKHGKGCALSGNAKARHSNATNGKGKA